MKVFHYLLILLIFGGIFTACSSLNIDDADKIVVSFRDSSVPPEYHRSYIVSATNKSATFIIHVYGDTLMDTTLNMEASRFLSFKSDLEELNIKIQEDENKACSGGTSVHLVIKNGNFTVLKGTTYMCSGESYGTISPSQEAILTLVDKHYPEVKSLVRSTELP